MERLTTLHWLAALRLPNIGPMTIGRWLAFFGDMTSILTASQADLIQAGASSQHLEAIRQLNMRAAEKDLDWCERNHCRIVLLTDPAYPQPLKETVGAPLVLFVRGDLELLSKPQIAIVGSRHPTVRGQELAQQFAFYLAKAGFTITSGFARGIDAAGHQGALASGGKTIAVLGNGLATIYPSCHRALFDQLLTHGALVSEFLPDDGPKASHFPRRNRVISGLSLGVLVIEAALKSGSLITARYAVEQGRDVFAVPGSTHNPLTRGCHQLIKQGAKLVETAQDIIEELGPCSTSFSPINAIIPPKAPQRPSKEANIDASAKQFLAYLGYETVPLDVIILRSGLTAAEVSSMLLTLELKGLVCRVPGGYTASIR